MAKEKKRVLTPIQRMAAELLGSGMRGREVALQVGVHQETITKWKRTAAFREAVQEAAETFIADMRLKALDVFYQHLEDQDKKIAQQAASQVLKLSEALKESSQDREVSVTFLHMPRPGEVMDKQDA